MPQTGEDVSKNETVMRLDRLKKKLGLKNDTEVFEMALMWFDEHLKEEEKSKSLTEHSFDSTK